MVNKTEPRIVLFDLETIPDLREVMKVFPGLSAYPGLTLKASICSILCMGYKIHGEKRTNIIHAWDNKKVWDADVNDDKILCEKIYNVLKDADALVTHNGRRFDLKFLQTRLLKHGLPPLPKIQHIDTCVLAKSNLLMYNNRLQTISKFLTSEEKMENGGWDLWVDVHNRKAKAMEKMSDYCKQDVVALQAIFKRLLPFVTIMPNYNNYKTREERLCPNCGSTRVANNGMRANKTGNLQRLRCMDCGTSSTVKSEKADPKTI